MYSNLQRSEGKMQTAFLHLTLITLANRSNRFIWEPRAPPPCRPHLGLLEIVVRITVAFRAPTAGSKQVMNSL